MDQSYQYAYKVIYAMLDGLDDCTLQMFKDAATAITTDRDQAEEAERERGDWLLRYEAEVEAERAGAIPYNDPPF